MIINLEEFMQGYKTTEIKFGDKKWVFREPTIKQILSLKNEGETESMVKEILIDGSYEDLDKVIQGMTMTKKKEFIKTLLKNLGLV